MSFETESYKMDKMQTPLLAVKTLKFYHENFWFSDGFHTKNGDINDKLQQKTKTKTLKTFLK